MKLNSLYQSLQPTVVSQMIARLRVTGRGIARCGITRRRELGWRFPELAARLVVVATSISMSTAWAQRTASPAANDTAVVQSPTVTAFEIPASDDGLPGAGPLRRADWFRQLWRERRSVWAGQIEQDRGAVVFLGDSITQGWGDDLAERFPGLKIANRGISGDTTRGVLIRLAEDVLSLQPAGVVLLIGTNDLEEQAEPQTIADNVRLILADLKKHQSELPVIVCAVFPSSAEMRRPAEKIREINRLLADVVRGDSQFTWLDTWTLFADGAGNAQVAEFPDLLHPNEAGYQKWQAALLPVLETRGLAPVPADEFQPEEGFALLFNGHDLSGWGVRPSSPEDIAGRANWRKSDPQAPPWPIVTEPKSYDGLIESPDGRYAARHGRLVVQFPAEGRKIQQLWTTREFPEDFVLRLEFRASPNADSGIFIRKPQLQCRDFVLAGPYQQLRHYRPQDWNEVEITVSQGRARYVCNGEVLEEGVAVPATGPIGLEGDRGQVEYRRIRVRELRP